MLLLIRAKGLEETGPTYRITRDFIFRSTPHHSLIYNPEYFEIVKQVNLQPFTRAPEVLHKLVGICDNTCGRMDQDGYNTSHESNFVRIPSNGATVLEGVSMCRKLGLQSIELRTREDVSQFLKEIGNSKEDTPAPIFYEQKIRSFVFFSDHLPVKGNSAILSTHKVYEISAYDTWDSYLNHFGKYVVEDAQMFQGFAHSDKTYDHFYCHCLTNKGPRTLKRVEQI